MNKTILYQLLALLLLFGITTTSNAQVTIGAGDPPKSFSVLELSTESTKGGLRMPHLKTSEREALNFATLPSVTPEEIAAKAAAVGLSIYNIDTKCIEYWNATKWISLCTGQAGITFEQGGVLVDITKDIYPSGGKETAKYLTLGNPDCTGNTEPYSFLVLAGSSFTQINVTNVSTGEFTINMDANPTARPRTAILRVTNNCTTEYSEFILMQYGATDVCDNTITTSPTIVDANGTVICGTGGAVYLTLTHGETPAKEYVWTLNDAELTASRGKKYHIATQAGVYRVYVGGVGCDDNASAKVAVTMNTAGDIMPVTSVYATNDGTICGAAATTKLQAKGIPATGTLTWYKNGIATGKSGEIIELNSGEIGDWVAVMTDGNCISKPSNTISVSSDAGSEPLPEPTITVNEQPLATARFCKGGYMQLAIDESAYPSAIRVEWYNNDQLLGVGTTIKVTAPRSNTFVLRCVVSDNTGVKCPAEIIAIQTLSDGTPNTPTISGPNVVCGPTSAKLNVMNSTGSYQWYRNGGAIPGATMTPYAATQGGLYSVQTSGNGCLSPMSGSFTVGISDYPTTTMLGKVVKPEPNTTKLLETTSTLGPILEYQWEQTGQVLMVDVAPWADKERVAFQGEGKAMVQVRARNECGWGDWDRMEAEVTSACIPVSLGSYYMSPASGKTIVGDNVVFSVSPRGTEPYTYQWKRNGFDLANQANPMQYAFKAAMADAGIYSVTVTGCKNSFFTQTFNNLEVTDLGGITPAPGSGTLSGQKCFDVVQSNFSAECGTQASRMSQQAKFGDIEHTYIFKATSAGLKNLKFFVTTSDGVQFEYKPQDNIPTNLTSGIEYKLFIKFADSNYALAKGRSAQDALKVQVTAVFDDATATQKKVEQVIDIQDCQCCGADGIPGTLVVGANSYLTHQYGNDCWMVSNSKEGTPSETTYPAKREGLRGYYYSVSQAPSACPSGWELPNLVQSESMAKAVIENTATVGQWWTGPPNLTTSPYAGVYTGTQWLNWGIRGDYIGLQNKIMTTQNAKVIVSANNGNVNFWYSVRCVKM